MYTLIFQTGRRGLSQKGTDSKTMVRQITELSDPDVSKIRMKLKQTQHKKESSVLLSEQRNIVDPSDLSAFLEPQENRRLCFIFLTHSFHCLMLHRPRFISHVPNKIPFFLLFNVNFMKNFSLNCTLRSTTSLSETLAAQSALTCNQSFFTFQLA